MKLIRKLLFKGLRYSGLPLLIREIWQRKTVTIVMFHDPAPDNAEQVFAFLARKYNIIDLNDYLEARRSGDAARLPDKAMIITLDDGHIRNYELLPVLQKLKIPVTIFLCAGIIDTNRHYWFKFNHPDLFKPAMKQMPTREKLDVLARAGFWPEKEFPEPLALNKGQIEEMKPYVNFQSHTMFHPCLPKCQHEEAAKEIQLSKTVLEDDFGLSINAIAYPNGDYSDRDIELVRQAGYTCGITVDLGFNTLHTDPFRLKRLSIDDPDNIDAVCVKATGLWTRLLNLVGKRRMSGHTTPVEQAYKPAPKIPTGHLTSMLAPLILNGSDIVTDLLCSALA